MAFFDQTRVQDILNRVTDDAQVTASATTGNLLQQTKLGFHVTNETRLNKTRVTDDAQVTASATTGNRIRCLLHLREVGGWGRDPKKCTGRDWGMGSSTI